MSNEALEEAVRALNKALQEAARLKKERDEWRRKYKELVERNHGAELKALAERENQG